MWKNDKFTFTAKKIREINSLVIHLVEPLVSRISSQKCVRVNSRNIRTVSSANCGNYGNLPSRIFGKNFVKISSLLDTLWKSTIKHDHVQKKIRESNSLVTPLVKTLI